jgi:hypothetical protein
MCAGRRIVPAEANAHTFVSVPYPLFMPDVYPRLIEPLIAIVLDAARGGETPLSPQTRYRCPHWAFPP